jgi:3-hydroxy-9,10-secoandrosta-1,3,5(10)-triene-9,17-dione monooxygenase reductase component
MTFTERTLRNTLGMFPTGVAVVTARGAEGTLQGVTINSFNSVSLDPPLVLFSLSRKLLSLDVFLAADAFAINFLQEDQQDLSVRFNKALSNKWEQVTYRPGVTGAPVILPALAVLECRPYAQYDGGDHVIVVGRVEHLECQDCKPPLVYFRGSYHKLNSTTQDGNQEIGALFSGW